eukprot:71646-Amphidinium_carterae.1
MSLESCGVCLVRIVVTSVMRGRATSRMGTFACVCVRAVEVALVGVWVCAHVSTGFCIRPSRNMGPEYEMMNKPLCCQDAAGSEMSGFKLRSNARQ